ncbi:MAG: hypothetical protein IIY77_04230, partial [Lachnospiraceae bacterium]|nr:hypothetical protein [Lachnospiraceae bacterium]
MINNSMNIRKRLVGLIYYFKRITIIILAFLAVFQVNHVYAYSTIPVYYWYSNSNNIGHWAFVPTISKINYSSGTSFYFLAGYSHARTQWSQAGISTIDNGSNSSSNIVCKGGTITELANNSNVTESMLAGKNGDGR